MAERLRVLAEEVGLSVVSAANSLQLRDQQGTMLLLYPAYRSVEFPLDFLWQAGREAEDAEIRDTLQRIAVASKQVTPKATQRRLPRSASPLGRSHRGGEEAGSRAD